MDFGDLPQKLEIIYWRANNFGGNGAAHLLILTDQKLDLCTNSQQKHCIGEQIFLVVIELLNNAHHIREMDFGDLPQIWK